MRTQADRATRALRSAAWSTRWYQRLRQWETVSRHTIKRAKRGMSKARRRLDKAVARED